MGVLAILGSGDAAKHPGKFVDGLAQDVINGPIDADKLDYLVRDAASCGVPYGRSIDRERFLRALTVDVRDGASGSRLALAYRAKGTAALESLLLARYQMYGAVYWHHTFRCIQAMFTHAVAESLAGLDKHTVTIRGTSTESAAVREFFYYRVICALPLVQCREILVLARHRLATWFFHEPPASLAGERSLEICLEVRQRRYTDTRRALGST